ncbi:MAG: DUF2283 domain-containing protein [Ignavibacteria bacterium]|jgi:uncharacterized protein YuzE|nr:DUF2283 domain-containing protein [Ignavibacteria bacterium]
MKVKYDSQQDILYLQLRKEQIFESDEDRNGVIIDYSADGQIVGIELLNATKSVESPMKVEYEFA